MTGSQSGPAGAISFVTADVPLAARMVKFGAADLAPNGRPFTEDSVGRALASRNRMDELRSACRITGGPKPFAARAQSSFLSALDLAISRLKRTGFGSWQQVASAPAASGSDGSGAGSAGPVPDDHANGNCHRRHHRQVQRVPAV